MAGRLAFLVVAPLALAGVLAAHALDYRIAHPEAGHRHRVLAETGHGYLDHLPALAAVLAVLLAVGVVARAAAGRGNRVRPRAWPLALLGPALFALQEHLERIPHGGAAPLEVVAEPTFLPGLVLQLPFALAAWLLARAVLRLAGSVGEALRRALRLAPPGAAPPARPVLTRRPRRRLPALATGAAGRAPPAVSPSSP